MGRKKYDDTISEQLKEAVKNWQEGQGGSRWQQQEKAPAYDRGAIRTSLSRGMTPVYDRGADVSRPDKGARNTLIDQQRQEERKKQEEEKKRQERLAAYNWLMNKPPEIHRNEAIIGKDMEAVDRQIEEQKKAEKAAEKAAKAAANATKPYEEKLPAYVTGNHAKDSNVFAYAPGIQAREQPQTQGSAEKTVSPEMEQLLQKRQWLESELYQSKKHYYDSFTEASDFKENSVYVPQEEKKMRAIDIMLDNYSGDAPWDYPLYEYVNGNKEAEGYITLQAANYYGPGAGAIGKIYGQQTENKSEVKQMTEEEVAIFNYLYKTKGMGASNDYYRFIQSDLYAREREADEKYWAEYAEQDPFAASLFSVVTSPTKGLSYLGQFTDYIADGEMTPNAPYNKFVWANSAIRTQVTEKIEKNWGKVGSFAYNTGLGMLDFLYTSALTANTPIVTLTVMGSGAAADTVIAAKDRGLSDDQAFALGTIAGITEAAVESINLETVFDMKFLKESTLKYMLKNGMAEGKEEVITETVNLLADIYISKDKSQWQRSIDYYKDQGYSQSKAVAKAFGDQALNMALAYGGGFLSGNLISGGRALIAKHQYRNSSDTGIGSPLTAEDTNVPTETPEQGDIDWLTKGLYQSQQENAPQDAAPEADPAADFNRVAAEVIPREQAVQEPEPEYSDDVFRAAVDEMMGAQAQKNTDQQSGRQGANETAGIKQQIQASQETLAGMEPVAQINTPREFARMNIAEKMKWVIEKLRPTNYQVDRKGFGIINFSAKQIKQAFKYFPKGGAEEASFEAIPYVLKNGTEISSHENHKGREYSTVTFAAPVNINGKRGNMAVVVKQTKDNRYKIHRVFSPDGSMFELSETTIEAEPTPGGGVTENGSLATPISSASNNNIADDGGNVNGQNGTKGFEAMGAAEDIGIESDELVEDVDGSEPGESGMEHGSVGADTHKFKHEVRKSKVYDNTFKNATDPEIKAAGQKAQEMGPRIGEYDYISEEESLANAELRTRDARNRWAEYHDLVNKQGWTGEDNDTAFRLLKHFQKTGKTEQFKLLARAQREQGTTAGQMVQSFAKYSRDATKAAVDATEMLDGMGKGDVPKKFWKKSSSFDQWKDDILKSTMKIANDIEAVEDGDAEAMRNIVRQLANFRKTTAFLGISSKLTKNAQRILKKMDFNTAKDIACAQLAKIPDDFRRRSKGEVIKTIRYLNMLSSLTTINRNLVGNGTMGIVDAFSDATAGRFADMLLAKVTGKRTVGNDIRYGGTYLRAARDAADMASLLAELDIPPEHEGKYTGRTRTFSPQGGPLSRFFSAYEKYMNYALQVTDEFFSGGTEGAVIKSLETLGEKSGLTEEEIASLGDWTGRRRTFKEGRRLARASGKIKEGLNVLGTEDFGAGDVVLTFAETPAEMGQVAIDYSAGVVEGFAEIASIIRDAKNGETIDVERQRKAVSDFGRGVTGPAMIAMFTAFAAAGIIAVHDDEDEDKRSLEQSMGLSGAQLNLSAALRWLMGESTEWRGTDQVVSIDFLQPFNSQMYIGYLLSQEENVADMIRAYPKATLQGVTQSILDIPMMGTIEDIADLLTSFGEVSEGDLSAVKDAAGKLIGDQASSFIPAWMRQTAYSIDPVVRDTTGENTLDAAWNRVKSNIPFVSKTLPAKLDGFGNEQRRYDDPWLGVFNIFANPGELKRIKTSDIMDRLEEYGDKTLYPEDKAPGSFMVDGEKVIVSGKEMTETYQKTYGENISGLYGGLMDNEDFNKLPEEAQIAALKQAQTYATQLAKASVSDFDDIPEGTTEEIVQGILQKQADKLFTDSMEDTTDAWKNGKDDTEATAGLEEAYQVYKGLSEPMQETVFEGLSERVKGYIEARDGGQEPESYMGAAKAVTLAEHHIDALRDAWKEGEDGSATFTDLDQAYELYRGLDDAQRKQVLEMASSKTRHFLEAREAGVNTETYTRLYQQYDQISSGEGSGTDQAEQWSYTLQKAVEAGQITQEQANTLREEMGFYQMIPADAKKYDEMTAAGISADDAKDMMWLLDGIEGTGSYNEETKKNNVRPTDRYTAIAGATFVSDQEKDIVMKMYMTDYNPTARQPDKTELKYDYARKVFGLTPELYVAAYQAHAENSTKAGKIEAWRELGFSSKEAYLLYRLFASSGKDKIDVVAWYEQQQAK